MKKNIKAEIIEKVKLKEDLYKFSVKAPEIVENAKPGHFIEVRVLDNIEPLLRRPISIYNIEKETGILEFIFQVKGKGTEILAKREVGEKLDIIGPLGYGTFEIKDYKNVGIIGGGIGTFPLYELAKELKGRAETTMYMGFRNKSLVTLEKEFEEVASNVVITTDDGSYKEKGYAINVLKEDCKKEKPDIIFACGPLPMLKAVQEFANSENIKCEMSLEERMGCGIGACVGCNVRIVTENPDEVKYNYVCQHGPVFNSKKVII